MDLNHAWSELAVLAQCRGSIREGTKRFKLFFNILVMANTKFNLFEINEKFVYNIN